MLKQNRVALWDVVWQCHRPGSLDSNIQMTSVTPNDFALLFSRCPKIEAIFFNGQKSEQLFKNLVLEKLLNDFGHPRRWRFLSPPSTSPAHASLSKAQKKARWHRELRAALGME